MSTTTKKTTLKALIDGVTVELMFKTTGDQVYLNKHTALSPKIEEIINALNTKAKAEDVNTTITDIRDDIGNIESAHSEYKTEVAKLLRELEATLKKYTDTKISLLINGAPTTLDTLAELADAFQSNKSVIEALNEAIGKKANQEEFLAHITNKDNPHSITKKQLGLENVNNTADADKNVKHALSADLADKATADTEGNDIPTTYAKKLEIGKITVSQEEPEGLKPNDIWFNVSAKGVAGGGVNQARVFDTYEEMISILNGSTAAELLCGQSIFIGTMGVPDLWVYSVETEWTSYVYTDDTTFANDLKENGKVQVGYYKLAILETEKVEIDFTDVENKITNLRTEVKKNVDTLSERGNLHWLGCTDTGSVAACEVSSENFNKFDGYRYYLFRMYTISGDNMTVVNHTIIPSELVYDVAGTYKATIAYGSVYAHLTVSPSTSTTGPTIQVTNKSYVADLYGIV